MLKSYLIRNILGCSWIITGYHDDPDTGCITFAHRFRDPRSYRIGKPDKTKERKNEVMLDAWELRM